MIWAILVDAQGKEVFRTLAPIDWTMIEEDGRPAWTTMISVWTEDRDGWMVAGWRMVNSDGDHVQGASIDPPVLINCNIKMDLTMMMRSEGSAFLDSLESDG